MNITIENNRVYLNDTQVGNVVNNRFRKMPMPEGWGRDDAGDERIRAIVNERLGHHVPKQTERRSFWQMLLADIGLA